jgi:hypothetical protein
MITQKVAANLCGGCGPKSNTGTDFSPRISGFHSVNSPTHSLVYRQCNMNIAIDSVVKQDIYTVIIAIEDKYFGVITNPVVEFSCLL